jgi:hypothetical protein
MICAMLRARCALSSFRLPQEERGVREIDAVLTSNGSQFCQALPGGQCVALTALGLGVAYSVLQQMAATMHRHTPADDSVPAFE